MERSTKSKTASRSIMMVPPPTPPPEMSVTGPQQGMAVNSVGCSSWWWPAAELRCMTCLLPWYADKFIELDNACCWEGWTEISLWWKWNGSKTSTVKGPRFLDSIVTLMMPRPAASGWRLPVPALARSQLSHTFFWKLPHSHQPLPKQSFCGVNAQCKFIGVHFPKHWKIHNLFELKYFFFCPMNSLQTHFCKFALVKPIYPVTKSMKNIISLLKYTPNRCQQ